MVLIHDVKLFDGDRFVEHQDVLVEAGRISKVSGSRIAAPNVEEIEAMEEIDGNNRTLLPGLIDAHVHVSAFYQSQALQQALAFGVTTVVDMWTTSFPGKPLKDAETSDSPDMAAVLMAGTGVTAPGGHPAQMAGPGARAIPTLASAADADAFVAARIVEGSDFIKVILDDTNYAYGRTLPTLDVDTIKAVVKAAHARGKLVIAHIGTEKDARTVIDAGVDGLAHIFQGPTVSDDFAKFAKAHGVFVIPTLSVLYGVCGTSDGPEMMADAATMRYIRKELAATLSLPGSEQNPSCAGSTEAVNQLFKAGVPLLAGTDAPGPGTAYGVSLLREVEHLTKAGMPPAAALAAATSVPSRVFGLKDRGQVKPGMRADLVLVQGDPSKQIRDIRNIVAIWKRGVRFERIPVN